MIRTKQKTRKQISDLVTDLEIINPIESKSVLGGEWYDGDTYYGGWLSNINIGGGGDSGNNFDNSGGYNPDLYGGYQQDWNNYGGDNNGSGGGDYGDNYDNNGSDQDSRGSELPNLPATVEQQLGGMGACVSYAMSFMSSYLGNNIDGATMALHNARILNVSAMVTMTTGLSFPETTQAIQAYFNTTTLTTIDQIVSAVQGNLHGVLANVYVHVNPNDPTSAINPDAGHQVAIVGYDASTGQFMAADSNTGGYSYYYANQINMGGGVYEVNGVR